MTSKSRPAAPPTLLGSERRGGASAFGYAETNEDLFAYGLGSHPHVPEIEAALSQLGAVKASVAFTPHLVPMSRGLLATCYARPRGAASAKHLHEAAIALYREEHFVRVVTAEAGAGPHTGWATGSNYAFSPTRSTHGPVLWWHWRRSTTSARAPRARRCRTLTS